MNGDGETDEYPERAYGYRKLPIQLGLTQGELDVLSQALRQFGGPTRPSDRVAAILGLDDAAELGAFIDRFAVLVDAAAPMTLDDWSRVITLAEITWSSAFIGVAYDWQTVTGLEDGETMARLRQVQWKFSRTQSRLDQEWNPEPCS